MPWPVPEQPPGEDPLIYDSIESDADVAPSEFLVETPVGVVPVLLLFDEDPSAESERPL
jgi:hypothetical protein